LADDEQLETLTAILYLVQDAGAIIVNNTELPNRKKLVSQTGWNWDYGTARGFPNESEYTYVKVDFYNNIATYLSELSNTNITSLQDIVNYNFENDGTEGGSPWPLGNPAFYSGQDGFLASLNTSGIRDQTYWQALDWCKTTTRNDALLVPPDVAQSYQIAAQAGYPMIAIPAGTHSESGMPFGLALMQTAWEEGQLIKWASAIEDIIKVEGKGLQFGRTLPQWRGYSERNIPVINEVYA
jgi:amidase